ncbi:hypothetical protein ACVDG3_22695 [Meridianimarinicoccus sp. RP-17]|uniref:hypothetical protein n=1 Tax=Meridianimarinicoccus zhengii TaxID=2056810 RepID=UPI000DAB6DA2|nr:hypothetical protein [Phycocomes zhengii]
MTKKYLFADEAGCFTFTRSPNVSTYFIICTVMSDDLNVAADLVKLRRKMIWEREDVQDYFHATEDKQVI